MWNSSRAEGWMDGSNVQGSTSVFAKGHSARAMGRHQSGDAAYAAQRSSSTTLEEHAAAVPTRLLAPLTNRRPVPSTKLAAPVALESHGRPYPPKLITLTPTRVSIVSHQ